MRNRKEIDELGASFGNSLRQLVDSSVPQYNIVGEVVSVDFQDIDDAKCTVAVDDGYLFEDIDLNLFPMGRNSILLVPTEGSKVLLDFIEGYAEKPILSKTTEIDQIWILNNQDENSYIRIENDYFFIKRQDSMLEIMNDSISLQTEKFNINADLTTFNGGNKGGMVLINDLTSKLNGLVQEISTAFSTLNNHTHMFAWAGTSGSSTTQPMMQNISNPSQFNASDYESDEIKQ